MSDSMTQPTPESLARFAALPDDRVIHMINFLKYRDLAEYPEGHEHAGKGWSGRRAYEEYATTLGPIFDRIGARMVWRAAFEAAVIGHESEDWDDVLIAEYPNSKAFMAMVADPEYQAVAVNRTAALTDTRLIRTNPAA